MCADFSKVCVNLGISVQNIGHHCIQYIYQEVSRHTIVEQLSEYDDAK